MKKRARRSSRVSKKDIQINWLPIDNRLIPDVFSFSHVKGVARVFLMIEMILAIIIVFGSIGLAVIKLIS
jgi:hypothetical protein